ncbi:NAD(P)-dependent oxidoreductase [Leifsonia sp. NPDC056665]|uniref:NAD(P)-dependent oxidoreductase n=1 Tax=Leifsonia sp. NPDC056665 TaxID=3345901 RepID=UPI0036A69631
MQIGFIGLGIMGLPMATNLVREGFSVVAYSRSAARTHLLVDRGGVEAASVAEVAAVSDVVITMLPDGPDVEAVLLGPEGVIAHARQSTVLIDMSTIHPEVSRRVAAVAAAAGLHALDAPVSGGEPRAIDGTLSIMVGGDRGAFDRMRDLFGAMGRTAIFVGGAGAGQSVKAANQMIVAVNMGAVAEALTMLEALDVDADAALPVLSGGLAGSAVLEQKGRSMLRREFGPGFRSVLHHKDMGIALEIARDAGVATPLAGLAAQEIAALVSSGRGGLDHSGMKAVVDQLSGRS